MESPNAMQCALAVEQKRDVQHGKNAGWAVSDDKDDRCARYVATLSFFSFV